VVQAAKASDLAEPGEEPLQVGPKKSRKRFVDMKPDCWAKKTILDVAQLSILTITHADQLL
jgi:hypothetical protein